MYYVPVTESYVKLPVSYVPLYSTTIDRTYVESTTAKLSNDLSQVKKELADIRGELTGIRLEKEKCPICLVHSIEATTQPNRCDETCSICYPRVHHHKLEETYSRPLSPVHYCPICSDYVIDQDYPPPSPSPSPRLHRRTSRVKYECEPEVDKLSEYLSRQLDLHRLRHRYIPQQRPVWIPTAYKQDYPHRRWATRDSNFSEP